MKAGRHLTLGQGACLLLSASAIFLCACDGTDGVSGPAVNGSRDIGRRIESAVASIERTMAEAREPLSVAALAARTSAPTSQGKEGGPPAVTFRVSGIIRNEGAPLVMTTCGVAGLGDEVDGFTVVSIQGDTVTFADGKGRRTIVPLYEQEDATP